MSIAMLCLVCSAGLVAMAIFGLIFAPVDFEDLFMVLLVTGGISLFVTGLIAAIVLGGRAAGATTCRNWGRESGFVTKMVVLNWSDPGTCLARTPSGRWVQNTSVQQFINGGK